MMTRNNRNRSIGTLLVVLSLCYSCYAVAFAVPSASLSARPSLGRRLRHEGRGLTLLLPLRGGDASGEETEGSSESSAAATVDAVDATSESKGSSVSFVASIAPITAFLQSAGGAYSSALNTRPILTKALTASLIFGLSDFSAQQIEGSGSNSVEEGGKKEKNWTRIITASLVGLLYFGPAAHAWYETIFKILPGTSLVSTLQKAALGQLLFGPSFTCVFFATSLMQSGTFSLGNWFTKIKQDLPGAWAAGLSFWPLVDLVSYSLIPAKWIPLFVNFCSFVWTIYLSIVANRRSEE